MAKPLPYWPCKCDDCATLKQRLALESEKRGTANPFFLALGIVAFMFAGFNLALSLYGTDFISRLVR